MGFTAAYLVDDMNNKFLDSGFEEDIVYMPSGEIAKTIKAIVHRDGSTETVPSRRTGASENKVISRSYDISVEVSTDATEGIGTVTIKENRIALKRRVNDSSNTIFLIRGIIQEDVGAYWLGLGN